MECPKCGKSAGWAGSDLLKCESQYSQKGEAEHHEFVGVVRHARLVKCISCGKAIRLSTILKNNKKGEEK